MEQKCQCLLQSGSNQGKQCPHKPRPNSLYCGFHQKCHQSLASIPPSRDLYRHVLTTTNNLTQITSHVFDQMTEIDPAILVTIEELSKVTNMDLILMTIEKATPELCELWFRMHHSLITTWNLEQTANVSEILIHLLYRKLVSFNQIIEQTEFLNGESLEILTQTWSIFGCSDLVLLNFLKKKYDLNQIDQFNHFLTKHSSVAERLEAVGFHLDSRQVEPKIKFFQYKETEKPDTYVVIGLIPSQLPHLLKTLFIHQIHNFQFDDEFYYEATSYPRTHGCIIAIHKQQIPIMTQILNENGFKIQNTTKIEDTDEDEDELNSEIWDPLTNSIIEGQILPHDIDPKNPNLTSHLEHALWMASEGEGNARTIDDEVGAKRCLRELMILEHFKTQLECKF